MAFKEVAALDADVIIALGKKNKQTGKPYPKQIEGYYLGFRTVNGRKGESNLHFFQTNNGNVGVWGTTDLDRKLKGVPPGTMVRATSTGTKPTPNGEMYTYKVEVDSTNTIEVDESMSSESNSVGDEGDNYTDNNDLSGDEEETNSGLVAQQQAKKEEVARILNRNKNK